MNVFKLKANQSAKSGLFTEPAKALTDAQKENLEGKADRKNVSEIKVDRTVLTFTGEYSVAGYQDAGYYTVGTVERGFIAFRTIQGTADPSDYFGASEMEDAIQWPDTFNGFKAVLGNLKGRKILCCGKVENAGRFKQTFYLWKFA